MAKKLYLQENLLIYTPPAKDQFSSGAAGTGTVDIADWITEAAADGTITIAGGGGGAVTSVAGRTGVVTLVKADVGLSNVNNTSDASKPISTATQAALDTKQGAITLTTTGTGAATFVGSTLNIPTTTIPATTNVLTITNSAITSTVDSIASTVSITAGTIQDTLGFNAAGDLVRQVVVGGAPLVQYSAGNNVLVTATGTGITATKASGIWTITVPTGVTLIDAHVHVQGSDVQILPDAGSVTSWVNIIFTGAGINSGATPNSFRFPEMQQFLVPSAGAIAAGNAITVSATQYSVIGVGANTFTLRKASMSSTNDSVLTFTGF